MSHFEKIGVIFITGLVAIILALSLFGSGKPDPENALVLKDPVVRDAVPPSPKVTPVRRARDSETPDKNQALWDAMKRATAKPTPRPSSDGDKTDVTPVVLLNKPNDATANLDNRDASAFLEVSNAPAPKKSVDGAVDGPTSNPNPKGDVEHVIANGENYYSLARRYYHDPSKWQLIANRNKIPSERLRAGTKIVIPPLPAKTTPAVIDNAKSSGTLAKDPASTGAKKSNPPTPDGDGAARTYKVKKGDTLSGIAQSQLGTVKLLAKLEDANRDVLKDHAIREGMTLRIPATKP
ncbi:MAG: LysM peptidoglycan-binding domain-containing protein [Planctomycetes bacterium]|nr:LysM peptidoglycan-binding domain-containing protein [Planctomycetota bacterium]MBI3844417.1 LysM peptidoglycan-binding domain-containing protein [Planctomycetota bacterium]